MVRPGGPRWLRERPETLGLLRIIVPLLVLSSPYTWSAWSWARVPKEAWVLPVGLSGWAAELPVGPASVGLGLCLLTVGCLFGALGIHSRVSLSVATVAAWYVLSVPQRSGSVTHGHHLVWFLGILAASRSGDVMSWGARKARGRAPSRDLAYGVPIWMMRFLVAVIFFFPGWWKLQTQGLGWIESDNLRNLLHAKWFQSGELPAWRIDRSPGLLSLLSAAALIFELGFVGCLWSRPLRSFGVGVALGFHAFTQVFLSIRFSALWLTYPMFFDAARFRFHLTGVRFRRVRPGGGALRWVPAAIVGGLLLVGNVGFGVLGITEAWPFACYPKFSAPTPPELPSVAIEVEGPAGRRTILRGDEPGRPEVWARRWALLRGPPATLRFTNFLKAEPELLKAAQQAGVERLYFSAVVYGIEPLSPGALPRAPRRTTPLFTLELGPHPPESW